MVHPFLQAIHQYWRLCQRATSAQRAAGSGGGQRPARSQRIPSSQDSKWSQLQPQAHEPTSAVRRIRVRCAKACGGGCPRPPSAQAARQPLRFLLGQCGSAHPCVHPPPHDLWPAPAITCCAAPCDASIGPPIHGRLKRSRDSTGWMLRQWVGGGRASLLRPWDHCSTSGQAWGVAAPMRVTQVARGVIAAGRQYVLATMSCSTTSYELHSPLVAERRARLSVELRYQAELAPCREPLSSMCRSLAQAHYSQSVVSDRACDCSENRAHRRLAAGGPKCNLSSGAHKW